MSSIAEQTPYNEHTGNGVATAYGFEFEVTVATQLKVKVDGALVSSADYTVSGVGVQAGGTVTFDTAPASAAAILIYRDTALARTINYTTNGPFPAPTVNKDFNYLWMVLQEILAGLRVAARVLRFPLGDAASAELPSAADRAGGALVFDEDGNADVSLDIGANLAAIAANAASALASATAAAASALNAAWSEAQAAAIVLGDFLQSGTGALARTFPDKNREALSITDYAADGVSGDRVDKTGVIDSLGGIQAAIDYAETVGGGRIILPPGEYECGGGTLTIAGASVTLDGYGATLKNVLLYIDTTATDTSVLGVRFLDDTGVGTNYHFDIRGTRFLLENVTCDKTPASDGYQGYIRQTSSYGVIRGLRAWGSNGFFIAGHDHAFSDCHLEASDGDDAYVLKGGDSTGPFATYNISITGGTVRNYSAILSIGSEVGQVGAAGTYTGMVRNVVVQGVNAIECQHLVYIKPGAITGDYRNGLVENITMIGCNLLDEEGAVFESGIKIWAGRGAIVRGLRFSDCMIRARCDTTSVTRYGLLEINVRNQGDAATIEDVEVVNCSAVDVYDGVDSGVGSAVGNPMDWVVGIEKENTALGTIGRVVLDNCYARGTKAGGILKGANVTGPIILNRPQWRNIAVSPASSVGGGIYAQGSITVRDADISVTSLRGVGASALTSTTYNGEQAVCYIGSIAAGSGSDNSLWVAPRDAYVWKIELVNGAAITQDDANYSAYEFRNMATAANATDCSTKVTGGIAVTDDSPPVATASATLANANTLFPKGTVMRFRKTDTGTGQATTQMYAIIHYVPYGR